MGGCTSSPAVPATTFSEGTETKSPTASRSPSRLTLMGDSRDALNTTAANGGGASSQHVEALPTGSIRLDIHVDELGDLQFLGKGMFCSAFSCTYGGSGACAIKLARADIPVAVEVVNKDLSHERDLLLKLRHPSICQILGAGVEPAPFLLLERLQEETLQAFVGNEPGNDPSIAANMRRKRLRKRLPLPAVYRMGSQLAEGLAYLHEQAVPGGFIVHRDLKPANVGFASDGHIRLFDFGLAKLVEHRQTLNDKYEMTGETGSMRYMACEVALEKPYNEMVDVYSLALVLWEMLALRRPYGGMSEGDFHKRVVVGGLRPPIDKSWPPEMRSVLEGCWDPDPDKRYPASRVAQVLHSLYAATEQYSTSPISGG